MTTTAIAPTNIALLKYWGREPGKEELSIPTKSSISFTVEGLVTTTTMESDPRQGKARAISLELNGVRRAPDSPEHCYIASFFKTLARFYPELEGMDFRIVSNNNFPTAAGFASSASGFAALAKALSGEVPDMQGISERRLSALARIGSGSAARSIPSAGGLVLWRKGGIWSSYAESLERPEFWPDLRIIYATVESKEKKVKSRDGMQLSVKTNPLYRAWARYEERKLKGKLLSALGKRDAQSSFELIMNASNNFHQICLGTSPSLRYLGAASFSIMDGIEKLNEGEIKAAYTFDAGPNAVVFTLARYEKEVKDMLAGRASELRVTRMGKGACFSDRHLL